MKQVSSDGNATGTVRPLVTFDCKDNSLVPYSQTLTTSVLDSRVLQEGIKY
jgi:hypothetical protein